MNIEKGPREEEQESEATKGEKKEGEQPQEMKDMFLADDITHFGGAIKNQVEIFIRETQETSAKARDGADENKVTLTPREREDIIARRVKMIQALEVMTGQKILEGKE